VLIVGVGTALILISGGAAIGVAHGFAVSDVSGQVVRLTLATVAQVPAAWVVGSLVVLIFGVAPRLTIGVWGVLVVFIVQGEFGVLWRLPQWLLDLSPFAHSPRLPSATFDAWSVATSLSVLTSVAILATLTGLATWHRRDLSA
jgi:ABC-2 type transport system permease protein